MANKTETVTIRLRDKQLKEWRTKYYQHDDVEDMSFAEFIRKMVDKGTECTGHGGW